jgi:nucleotide-binding universal stress UspA family protein
MADVQAPDRPVSPAILRKIGDHLLKRAKAQAARRRIPTEGLEIADGPVASLVVAAASATDSDIIVMGSRGLRMIESLSFGSTSLEVCRSAHCTCIAVH